MTAVTSETKAPRRRVDIAPTFSRRWGWLVVLGVIQVLAGAGAIAIPWLAALIAATAFGWILIIAGVFHLVHAVTVRQWQGFALHLVGGLLYAFAGVMLLWRPVSGVAALAMVIAVLLIVEGALRAVLAFSVRPRDGWGWFLAAGVASVVLGAVLFVGWPATSLILVGWLLGFQLLFSGAMNLSCAFVCRGCHADSQRRDSQRGFKEAHSH